jgi:hypothetical protein
VPEAVLIHRNMPVTCSECRDTEEDSIRGFTLEPGT